VGAPRPGAPGPGHPGPPEGICMAIVRFVIAAVVILATNGLVVSAVLSGNRNFEGRIHSQVRAAFLASPPLVVTTRPGSPGRIDSGGGRDNLKGRSRSRKAPEGAELEMSSRR
jgi:hypothetical protein